MHDVKIVKIESYCIFCRDALQLGEPDFPSGTQPWESDVMCFFAYSLRYHDPDDERVVLEDQQYQFIKRTNIATSLWCDPDEVVKSWGLQDDVHLCDLRTCISTHGSTKETAAFCHIVCLQIAQSKLGHLSARKVQQIARQLRPLFLWNQASKLANVDFFMDSPSPSDLTVSTPLRDLFLSIRERLPLELIQNVLSYTSGISRALVRCLTVLRYVDKGVASSVPESRLVIHPLFQELSINGDLLRTIDILGERCLSAIKRDHVKLVSSSHHNSVIASSKSVDGFQVAFGTYGVVDLRVIFTDGSASKWIGCQHRRWVATYRGITLPNIRVLDDGFKIVDIYPEDYNWFTPTHLLWDYDEIQTRDIHISLMYLRAFGNISRAGFKYRLAQSISLDQMESLTMFCGVDGVCCIQVNGDKTRRIGSPYGDNCAITYFLRPGEFLKYLYVLTQGPKEIVQIVPNGPFLVAVTSNGRNLYCVPYMFHTLPLAYISYFKAPGIPDMTRIRRVFTDPSFHLSTRLGSIGVTFDIQTVSQTPSSRFITLADPLPRQPWPATDLYPRSGYLTTATFSEVKNIYMQRNGSRCVGLKIIRHSGSIDVLGQWDPSNLEASHTIYNQDLQRLDALTFVFSKGHDQGYVVTDIVIGAWRQPESGESTFVWRELEKELAWSFSPFSDHVEGWEGSMTELEVRDRSYLDPIIPT